MIPLHLTKHRAIRLGLFVILSGFSLHTQQALASLDDKDVPQELLELIPAGSKSIRLQGQSNEGLPCFSRIELSKIAYTITNSIPNADRTVDPKNIAQFQIGLGYELESALIEHQELGQNLKLIQATSLLKSEESYSSDSKTEARIQFDKDGVISSIRVMRSESGFFGYSKKADVVCNFQ